MRLLQGGYDRPRGGEWGSVPWFASTPCSSTPDSRKALSAHAKRPLLAWGLSKKKRLAWGLSTKLSWLRSNLARSPDG